MAKVRVSELAKEFGISSKDALQLLTEMGEFVKSASSGIEPPVVQRFKNTHGAALQAKQEAAPAAKPAKKAAASKAAEAPAEVAETPLVEAAVEAAPVKKAAAPGPRPGPRVAAEPEPTPVVVEAPAVEVKPVEAPFAAAAPAVPAAPAAPTARPAPRPGGAPRPGNNPFAPSQGMGRRPAPATPPAAGAGAGDQRMPRPPAAREGGAARPGMPRPNPAMMPKSPGAFGPGAGRSGAPGRPGAGAPGRPGAGGRTGAPGGFRSGPGAGGGAGAPGGGGAPGRPGGGGRPGPGGRGSTQGAFGRAGGPSRRGRKSKRAKRQEFDNMEAPTIGGMRVRKGNGEIVRLSRGASLTDFAEKVGVDAASLVQMLFHLGEMVTATQSVGDETLELLGDELNYVVQVVSPEDEDRELLGSFDLEFGTDEGDEDDLAVRPPVVTVMGHVDHGKTRLLDALRSANVVAGEAGGITQHIGAYQVHTEVEGNDRLITFIDTPGHEAFTAMRARGSRSSDIAVLVVAADDGVMPQTVEALNHAKAAGVPIVVAVNKIDKPEADPTKARGQLAEYGLVPEEYGGDTIFVDVSAKEGLNLDRLLEAIVVTADATLDLRANPEQDAQGLVVEAHLDRGRGPVATVLVQRGTLRVGDSIVAGGAYGRVRAMLDEHGENIQEALPSRPAMVLGLSGVPSAGQTFLVVEDDRIARQIAEQRESRERAAQLAKRRVRRTLEDFMASMEKGANQELNLILKGDVSGSVEALEDSLAKIDVGDEVSLRVIDRGVGAITETNVMLAAASDAIIIGFNVRPQGKATELADKEGVEMRYYTVIYQAIDEIEAALKGMLKPVYEEKSLGRAEIRAIFKSSKVDNKEGTIAGCYVTDGVIRRNAKARLLRNNITVVEELTMASLKREKDDVNEVRSGFECGAVLKGYGGIQEGDVIESYEMVEIQRS